MEMNKINDENKYGRNDEQVIGSIKAEERSDNPEKQVAVLKARIDGMNDEQLVRYMEQHHKSDVYLLIRDYVSQKRQSSILKDEGLAPRFKEIKKLAKQSWDHDHALATNLMVDKACTLVYSTLLKMIKVQQEDIDTLKDRLDALGNVKHECHCQPKNDVVVGDINDEGVVEQGK